MRVHTRSEEQRNSLAQALGLSPPMMTQPLTKPILEARETEERFTTASMVGGIEEAGRGQQETAPQPKSRKTRSAAKKKAQKPERTLRTIDDLDPSDEER